MERGWSNRRGASWFNRRRAAGAGPPGGRSRRAGRCGARCRPRPRPRPRARRRPPSARNCRLRRRAPAGATVSARSNAPPPARRRVERRARGAAAHAPKSVTRPSRQARLSPPTSRNSRPSSTAARGTSIPMCIVHLRLVGPQCVRMCVPASMVEKRTRSGVRRMPSDSSSRTSPVVAGSSATPSLSSKSCGVSGKKARGSAGAARWRPARARALCGAACRLVSHGLPHTLQR